MPQDLSHYLVIAVSSRALFDLEMENRIFEEQGATAYEQYQVSHEDEILKPGSGFPLVQAILKLNSQITEKRKAEVVIISRAGPSVALRIMNSIRHYGLDINQSRLLQRHACPQILGGVFRHSFPFKKRRGRSHRSQLEDRRWSVVRQTPIVYRTTERNSHCLRWRCGCLFR